jgi:hypothetical protein
MSLRAYQAALARLVIEPDFRADVRAGGTLLSGYDLSARERRRICAAAADRGMDITRTLHKGWRLNKVLAFLPATCALLGEDQLAQELSIFWRDQPPTSLYFLEEALAFSSHLQERARTGLTIENLREVLAYERSKLEARRPPPGIALVSH